jgi:G3E family GTPase
MQSGNEKAGRTPFLLVTGYLGSGKTTLINRWLRTPGGPRLGVVVNEFGQVGIDGALLQGAGSAGEGMAILELANGCVCCVRGTEMWDAALELVDRAAAEVILIETSGLVEPQALLDQYDLLPTAMARRIDLRGLLCVVDPLHIDESIGKRAEAVHQIELADCLLLTKLDRASPGQVRDAHALLDRLGGSRERAGLSLHESADAGAAVLRWALSAAERARRASRPATSHEPACDHEDGAPCTTHHSPLIPHGGKQLVAVSLHEPQPLLSEPLLQLFADLSPPSTSPQDAAPAAPRRPGGEVLRAKGIVRVLGPDMQPQLAAVHLAGHQVELQPLTATNPDSLAPGSSLVFIGEDLDEAWLRIRLSACRSGAA